jgi:hypothetical protein
MSLADERELDLQLGEALSKLKNSETNSPRHTNVNSCMEMKHQKLYGPSLLYYSPFKPTVKPC